MLRRGIRRTRRTPPDPVKYVLRLYVTGTTGRSVRAIQNIRRICRQRLPGTFELEVIDLYKQIELARADQIIAAPTLVRCAPLPVRRLIGDLSDEARVLMALDVQ